MHGRDAGVAEVMGSILLVGTAVSMTVALSIFVTASPGPPDETYAELNSQAFPGPDQTGVLATNTSKSDIFTANRLAKPARA
jgi:hypothetical protein